MSTAEILLFFETTRIQELSAFRALCNALKALLIKETVELWRRSSKGRMAVLDLGCGRGGDLRKWNCHRLRSYVGVDGGALCVREAAERHAALVSQGKSSVQAAFHTTDILREPLPAEAASVDAVASMFFLQFAFSSLAAAEHVLDEVARVLRDGGVLCAILPDGDRVAQLLPRAEVPPEARGAAPRFAASGARPQTTFGHFRVSRVRDSPHFAAPRPVRGTGASAEGAPAVGLAYNFALTKQACTEYLVSPKLLQLLLERRGFVGAGVGGAFIEGAQHFFSRGCNLEAVGAVLRGQSCSQTDWLSLSFFSVLLATKQNPQEVA